MKHLKNEKGTLMIFELVVLALVLVAGCYAFYQYNTNKNKVALATTPKPHVVVKSPSPTTTPTPSNLVTDYFAPAKISFTVSKNWTFDTSGEASNYFYEHPNEKAAQLRLPYPEPSGPPEQYTIFMGVDSVPTPTIDDFTSYSTLGQITLGDKTLYVVEGFDTGGLSIIFTSGCANGQCEFTLPNSNTYFFVEGTKGVQNPVGLDESMIPQIVSILESMKIQ